MTDHEVDNKARGPSTAEGSAASAIAGKPVAQQGSVLRLVKTVFIVFAIALAGIVALTYFGGDRGNLPFEYEGFD